MKAGPELRRRGFIGGALIGLGAAAGWVARKASAPSETRKAAPTTLDSRFAYDISEFERTDPKLLRYRPSHQFSTGFDRPKAIVGTADGKVWVTGDRAAKLFDSRGALEGQFPVEHPAHCLAMATDAQLLVGFRNSFEIRDRDGKTVFRSPKLGEKTYLTSIAHHANRFYLADAGNREVIVCDQASGGIIERFGKQDAGRKNPGFAIPSPYFDLAITADDRLHIANPGRLRIETYSLDGRFESSWGEPGLQIDRFCGCCNPVHFALTPSGDFITSEKGLARINIYSSDGKFKGAVAGPETLVENKDLAKSMNAELTGGAAFDVAVDPSGHVLALDPYRKHVHVFSPIDHG